MTNKTHMTSNKMPLFIVEIRDTTFVVQANSSQEVLEELPKYHYDTDNFSIKRVDNLIAYDELIKLIKKKVSERTKP